MSLPTDTPAAGRRNWDVFAGWLWIALLVVGYGFSVYKCIPRDELDLGETAFTFGMYFGLPLAFLLFSTTVYWLVEGVARLWSKRPDKRAPWIHLCVLFLLVGGIAYWPRTIAPPNPITPESESVYLALAAAAREHLSGSEIGGSLSLDPNSGYHSNSKVSDAARKRLDQMVPAYWPRSLLTIWIDADCVVLDRGSGMLGSLGVRIYDRGTVPSNSSSPKENRITDHLLFYRVD
jgi:hypothetical protein